MKPSSLIFDGVNFLSEYGLHVESFNEVPPELKEHIIEIPFGSDIDLVGTKYVPEAFSDRYHQITFNAAVDHDSHIHGLFTRITSDVNGKRAKYRLSWSPEVEYEGRLKIVSSEFLLRNAGKLVIEIRSSPWKSVAAEIVEVDSAGGAYVDILCGRRPSNLFVTSDIPVTVCANGVTRSVIAGAKIPVGDLNLKSGINRLLVITGGPERVIVSDISSIGETVGDFSNDYVLMHIWRGGSKNIVKIENEIKEI